MKHLRKFNLNENYEDVNGESNYIGGVDGEWSRDESQSEINYDIWTTKSGKTIPVSKMSIEHLINTLNAMLNYTITFKSIEVKENWARTILDEILKREKQTTEIPKDLKESFEEYDEDDEDGPNIEPEDCVCREEMEESGVEYTQDFHWDKDSQSWICEHCGTHQ